MDGIAALDVSPNGRRLVTCGSEPQVVIWAMEPILDAGAEANPAMHKKLAVLGEHNGFVLAVKWSHGGHLLASGASDAGVLIYKRSPAPAPAKLGSSFVNRENWRPAGPSLKGHSLDVTALSWLPGDGQLASSSMDGRVIVWAINAGVCVCVLVLRGEVEVVVVRAWLAGAGAPCKPNQSARRASPATCCPQRGVARR